MRTRRNGKRAGTRRFGDRGRCEAGDLSAGAEGSALAGALFRALIGNVLTIARAVDFNAHGVHRKPVENGHRNRSIAEVLSPFAERDVRGNGGRASAMAAVNQIEQHM